MSDSPVMLRAADASPVNVRFAAPTIELQAAAEEGKRPTFEMVAYTGVPMNAGGFYTPVIVELSGVKTANAQFPILLDHDPSKIIGQGEAKVDTSAIRVSGTVMGEDADATKVTTLAKAGFKWQASIGASVTRREFLDAGKKAVVNGREVTGPLMIARESLLQEVSFVAIGADHQTSAAVAASLSLGKGDAMNFDQWLQAKGFDPAVLSDGQKTTLKAAFDAENKPAPPVAPPVVPPAQHTDLQAEAKAARAEQSRQNEITKIAARFMQEHPRSIDEIEKAANLAIEAKSEPAAFELTMLRDYRNAAGVVAGRRKAKAAMTDKVLEAAICTAAGLGDVEKKFDEQTLEAADKEYRGGIGLQQVLLLAARENGCDSLNIRGGLEDVLRYSFPSRDIRAAGFSSISLPNILSNVANKFIVEAFMFVEDTWRKISAIRPVSDFKQITNHSLTGDLQYEEVGKGGEIPHGTLSEEVYNNQAKTYGKMLAITRQDIINDDLGAFAAVPRRLGRGGALKINDVFWTAFMDNSTFFTSGRGNYDDGTDTALDAAGLTKAMGEFWAMLTDPEGKPLGSMPKFLLVPPKQFIPARVLNSSTDMNPSGQTSSTAVVGNLNPFAGMFEVVTSKYLANSSYTGYSALAWYLLADPNDIPVIETCFLNGKEMPTVETADADFSQLGVRMRAYHDFGVTKQEYRGGCKFKGEA